MTPPRRLVVKFGGSVLRSGRDLEEAARLVAEAAPAERLVVVSAPFGMTDRLASLAAEIRDRIDPSDEARLLATGERMSAHLLAAILQRNGIPVHQPDPTDPDWPVRTRGGCLDAQIDVEASEGIARRELLPRLQEAVVVLGGFLGREGDRVTTLRRGGSDTTALALGQFLSATDVVLVKGARGVLTADPRIVPGAEPIPEMTPRELARLVRAGNPVVAKEALPFLGPGPRVRIVPLGAPLLGSEGTVIRPRTEAPLAEPSPAPARGTLASVTAVLGPRPDGLAELLRILGDRPWSGLSATADAVSVFVGQEEADDLVRALHATGAFSAVTSRRGMADPPDAARSTDERAGPSDAGHRSSWLPEVGEPAGPTWRRRHEGTGP